MSRAWRISASGEVAPPSGGEPWTAPLEESVIQWRERRPCASTSGSTGPPRECRYAPQAVEASAHATARHFGLDFRTVCAWSALPATGTGGRMMVWRALVLGWDLSVAEPSACPVMEARREGRAYDFAVATPMQARHLMATDALPLSKQWLLGGAPLPPGLEVQLMEQAQASGCTIHHGFGMTETLTHIATRPLGSALYRPLPGIALSSGASGGLVVDAPERGVVQLQTEDAVELVETENGVAFRWLGRLDDVINSGGLKVHPAALERTLSERLVPFMGSRRWYLVGREDGLLGQRITLVVEGPEDGPLAERVLSASASEGTLRPRAVEFKLTFSMTPTGKVRRI